MLLLLLYLRKVSSSLTPHPSACVSHLASCPSVGISSYHIVTRRLLTVQEETPFTELSLQCIVIFVLVIVVHLLLCLIDKLNFIIGNRHRKKPICYVGFSTLHDFRHPLGALERIPRRQGRTTILAYINLLSRLVKEARSWQQPLLKYPFCLFTLIGSFF